MQRNIFWLVNACGIFFCYTVVASSGEKSLSKQAIPATGRVISSSVGQDDEVILKPSRERSPELMLDQPIKRRSLQLSPQQASKENHSGNSACSESSKESSTPDLDGRKRLYAALHRNEHEVVKTLIVRIALDQQLVDRQKIEKHYQTMKQLLPRFNDLLRQGLQPFPGYTYVDILCSVPAWHEALMGIFFDELARGLLSTSTQALRARYYAVKSLEKSLKRIIKAFFVMMEFENPVLITRAVKTLLNPDFVSQTFELFLYEQLNAQLHENDNRVYSANYEKNTQEIGIFELLASVEKDGVNSPEKSSAQ